MRKVLLAILMCWLMVIAAPGLAAALDAGHEHRGLDLNTFKNSVVMSLNSDQAFVNGIEMPGKKPVVKNGRTMVPLRFVGENMQARVDWEPVKKEIRITDGDKIILLTIGSKDMLVAGKKIKIEVPAMLRDGVTYLPLRTIGDVLGKTTEFKSDGKLVIVSSQPMDLNDSVLNILRAVFNGNYQAPGIDAGTGHENIIADPPDQDIFFKAIEDGIIIEHVSFDLNQDGVMDQIYMVASPLGVDHYFTAPAYLFYAISPAEEFQRIPLDFPPIDLMMGNIKILYGDIDGDGLPEIFYSVDIAQPEHVERSPHTLRYHPESGKFSDLDIAREYNLLIRDWGVVENNNGEAKLWLDIKKVTYDENPVRNYFRLHQDQLANVPAGT